MGVRGLTTYIASNHKKYHKNFKLHDCYIIIDGNSLAYQIYSKFCSRAHCAFGGDYDRYAQYVKDFFILLSKCDVKPIVVFDGGYEPRKVSTVIHRMKDRIAAMKHIQPASQNCPPIYPLLMKTVMKEILRENGIPLVQCDNEADQEIASLARRYDCPVLSYDSDFYIFDVSYIPIPTLEFEAVPVNFQIGETCNKFCINCKIYKVDFFLASFGGLDKSMLPLLASLLGNDYVKMKVFRKFFSHFKLPKTKSQYTQKKIARLIEWLRNETFDSAIERVLGRMKVDKRQSVKKSIMRAANAYSYHDSILKSYLPPEFTSRTGLENPSKSSEIDCDMTDSGSTNDVEGMDVEMNDKECNDDNSQPSDESSLSEEDDEETADMDAETIEHLNNMKEMASKNRMKIPEWLRDSSRKGKIEPSVFDIMTLRTYFALPQSEDNFFINSHSACIPLLKNICKLLLGDYFKNISLWMRNKNCRIQRFVLHLQNTPKVVDIEAIPTISGVERRSLLLSYLGITDGLCLDSFPDEWKLYFCAIVYWIKTNSDPEITQSHVLSLLMCIVALSVIDSKLGYYRKKIGFLKKYGKMQKKIVKKFECGMNNQLDEFDESFETNSCEINASDTNSNSTSITIKQICSLIDIDECIAAFDGFYQCHLVDESLKVNPKAFSTRTIHSFAQFQSCLYHVIILNSLLNHPFDQPYISHLYSSTFVYNMCSSLNKVNDVSKYIQSLLNCAPNILKLVESMFSALTSVVEVKAGEPLVKKNRRKKKKKVSNVVITDDMEDEDENNGNEGESDYCDENNAFSVLSVA